MAFESHMKELRELTQKLEQGNLPLEEAIALYTKGMELTAACQKELQTANFKSNGSAGKTGGCRWKRRIRHI